MIGLTYLTKFERCRILGARVRELSNGACTMVEFTPHDTLLDIAVREIKEKKCPIKIVRKCVNGSSHTIDTNKLDLLRY